MRQTLEPTIIASKLSETAMLKLRDNIASKVTETYTETVFDSISEAGDGMQEAADGSGKIEDGLNTAADGNKTITKNLKKLSTSTLTFVSGADSLTEVLRPTPMVLQRLTMVQRAWTMVQIS